MTSVFQGKCAPKTRGSLSWQPGLHLALRQLCFVKGLIPLFVDYSPKLGLCSGGDEVGLDRFRSGKDFYLVLMMVLHVGSDMAGKRFIFMP